MQPFFNVSRPILSLTLLRLIEALDANRAEPKDANEKYDAFLKILEVRIVSAPLSRFLTCSHRRRPMSLSQKVMCNS